MRSVSNFQAVPLVALLFFNLFLGLSFAPAASAQNTAGGANSKSRVIGSLYTVDGQVTVRGWEQDLVRRNPGLSRYNWTPITAARPGLVVFRTAGPKQSLNQYHYTKPIILNTAELQQAKKLRQLRAEAKFAHCTQEQVQAVASYDNNSTLQQQSTYASIGYPRPKCSYPAVPYYSNASGERLRKSQVQGRLISVK